MFLPTETVFVHVSWWFGQFMYNIIASHFFPQQWIRISSLLLKKKEHRSNAQTDESSAAARTKAYYRFASFEEALI
jgi:hypothetical protein